MNCVTIERFFLLYKVKLQYYIQYIYLRAGSFIGEPGLFSSIKQRIALPKSV